MSKVVRVPLSPKKAEKHYQDLILYGLNAYIKKYSRESLVNKIDKNLNTGFDGEKFYTYELEGVIGGIDYSIFSKSTDEYFDEESLIIDKIDNILIPHDRIVYQGANDDEVAGLEYSYDDEFYQRVQEILPELFEFPTVDESIKYRGKKMNESFSNVFDSSLIDYSKDFERQDSIQKDINDTLDYIKHTMDYWISDGDMGEEIDELGYSNNIELKLQKGVLIINLLIDGNDDNYFSHVLFRMRKKEDYSPEKDEKVFNLITKNKIKVNVIDTEQNNKVVKRNLDYVFRYYEPTEAYGEGDEDEDKPLSEDEVKNDYDGVPMHINFELQNKLADITYGVQ